MRYIFLTMMFVSVLFSAQQRQIILGSFSVESNALFYSLEVQKKVDADTDLKRLMDKYSAKVEYKKVGNYSVVAICPFPGYPSLFQTMAEVQKQFPEAYAIKYPAFASMIQAKPMIEDEPTVIEKVEAIQDEVLQEEELAQEVESLEAEDEPLIVPDFTSVVKKPTPLPIPIAEVEADNYDEIMLILLLLLVVIAYIIYKLKTKKKDPLDNL